ncbi:MAG: AAA family ATPase, partial [Deltaproteobacteria bacterium]|nr:AAA family ATPase [Deltaproteobacteria bacterium]
KGWIAPRKEGISLSGRAGAETLFPLLRRIGSLYQRGGKTTVDNMDLLDMLLPGGGLLRISLTDVPPDSMKALGELFEVISGLVKIGDSTEAYLDITDPQEDCPFVKELKKGKKEEG